MLSPCIATLASRRHTDATTVADTGNGTLFNLGVAWVAALARHRMGRMQRMALWVRRLTGVVFVGLGLRLALASRV